MMRASPMLQALLWIFVQTPIDQVPDFGEGRGQLRKRRFIFDDRRHDFAHRLAGVSELLSSISLGTTPRPDIGPVVGGSPLACSGLM
jgi:hypothetical protein